MTTLNEDGKPVELTPEQKDRNYKWVQELRNNEKAAANVMRTCSGKRCCLAVAADVFYEETGSLKGSEETNGLPSLKIANWFGWPSRNPNLLIGEHGSNTDLDNPELLPYLPSAFINDRYTPHVEIAEMVIKTFELEELDKTHKQAELQRKLPMTTESKFNPLICVLDNPLSKGHLAVVLVEEFDRSGNPLRGKIIREPINAEWVKNQNKPVNKRCELFRLGRYVLTPESKIKRYPHLTQEDVESFGRYMPLPPKGENELETRMIIDLCKKINFELTQSITFHKLYSSTNSPPPETEGISEDGDIK